MFMSLLSRVPNAFELSVVCLILLTELFSRLNYA